MEETTQEPQTVETQETTTTEVPPQETQQAESPTGLDALRAQAEGATTTEAPAAEPQGEPEPYTPNFEFTVKDKKLEFDEWARPYVKDKETEAKFRDMFERVHGLDEVKAHRDTIRNELKETKEKYATLDGGLNQLNTYLQNNDFRSFAERLKIPKDMIIRYAIDELKYQELSPEQRQEIDTQRNQQGQLTDLQLQNQQLLQQNEQYVMQQAEFQLNSELQKPDVTQIAQAYDARLGKPGAFRQEVINRGAYYEQVHGKTITAAQAVQEIVQVIGGQASNSPQANTTPQQPTPSQVVATQKEKPVIPNVQGGGSNSPYKKRPQSIDDLRKMREQMLSQG